MKIIKEMNIKWLVETSVSPLGGQTDGYVLLLLFSGTTSDSTSDMRCMIYYTTNQFSNTD
jgi:hypothetical protein